MTRYALFAGQFYYPQGGINDLIGVFPDSESAEAAYWWEWGEIAGYSFEAWGHIVDTDTMQVVKEFEQPEIMAADYFPPEKQKAKRPTLQESKSKREQNERLAQAFIDALTVKPE